MLVIDKHDGVGYQKISSKKKTAYFKGDDAQKRKTQYNNEILLTESLEMEGEEMLLGCPIYFQTQLKFNQSNLDPLRNNLICYTQLSHNMCMKQSNSNQAEKQTKIICDYL